MNHAVNIPKLGLTMEEATLIEWHYADGAEVTKGTPLYTIETEKISSEIEAERDGFLEQAAQPDVVLPVGGLVGYLHDSPGQRASAARAVVVAAEAAVAAAVTEAPRAAHPALLALQSADGSRRLVSPVARKIAGDRGIDLSAIAGSGPGGVVLKRDVEAAPVAGPPAPQDARPDTPAPTAITSRRPFSGMRKAVAQRMMQSLAGTAQMTGFGKIDMTEAVRLRSSLVAAADSLGARITFTDMILKATAQALREMPEINASIIGDEIVSWSEVNIGLAVAVDDGLIVPVLRQVDRLSLVELSLLRQEMIEKARSRRLSREDIEGGTFSLSNFGSYGGDFETPILNPPQSALLGIGQITEEPAVRDGQIVIRSMMMISLTFDHRLIDGAIAGRFRARIRALLEQPALLLAVMR